jgi:hypothetical protein
LAADTDVRSTVLDAVAGRHRDRRRSNVPGCGHAGIDFMKADLRLLREAKCVGEALPAEMLDIVIFTTGIFAGPRRETTADGIERDLAVSYLCGRVRA